MAVNFSADYDVDNPKVVVICSLWTCTRSLRVITIKTKIFNSIDVAHFKHILHVTA